MLIILDSGHGIDTPGKCSPDKRLLEWKFARELTTLIISKFLGVKIINLMEGIDKDESLSSRCRRINTLAKTDKQTIVISIHVNAAGNGSKWLNAQGWSVFVSNNASNNSKRLADCLYNQAYASKIKTRKPSKDQKYWVKNLAICRDTNCPAVLVENMFMDNKQDVEYLLSQEGKDNLANIVVKGIKDYFNIKN